MGACCSGAAWPRRNRRGLRFGGTWSSRAPAGQGSMHGWGMHVRNSVARVLAGSRLWCRYPAAAPWQGAPARPVPGTCCQSPAHNRTLTRTGLLLGVRRCAATCADSVSHGWRHCFLLAESDPALRAGHGVDVFCKASGIGKTCSPTLSTRFFRAFVKAPSTCSSDGACRQAPNTCGSGRQPKGHGPTDGDRVVVVFSRGVVSRGVQRPR